MNPLNQFIEIAPDCTLKEAQIPQSRGNKHTIATIEFSLLSNKPYGYTLEELKFATHVLHKNITHEVLKQNRKQLMAEFFSKPHACMRASPLTKQYGWGAHYNEEGKIAIYPVQSTQYRDFIENPNMPKFFAMRSKRA